MATTKSIDSVGTGRAWIVVGLACAATVACSGPGRGHHPLAKSTIWKTYEAQSDPRAIALAGDPKRVWVAGIAAESASQQEANEQAIAECKRRREKRRMKAPCKLYAEGDRLVDR